MDFVEKIEVKKLFILIGLGLVLIFAPELLGAYVPFHDYWQIMVIFFLIQSYVLTRIEERASKEMEAQMRLVSIGVRFISALVFILILALSTKSQIEVLLIEFVILYLVFMTFELIMALANLRRNSRGR